MAKRPSPSPIYLAWEHIVFGMRRPNEWRFPPKAEGAWAQLWRVHVEGSNLAQTDVEDASLLCTLGWELAVQRQNFPAALERAKRSFEHPLWQTADETTQQWLLGNVALAHLYLGEETAALANYGLLLERQRPRCRVPLYIVRGHLYEFSREQPAQERASDGLARLASDVVRRFKGGTCLAQRIVPGVATFGQVAEVLAQTFPEGVAPGAAAGAIPDDKRWRRSKNPAGLTTPCTGRQSSFLVTRSASAFWYHCSTSRAGEVEALEPPNTTLRVVRLVEKRFALETAGVLLAQFGKDLPLSLQAKRHK